MKLTASPAPDDFLERWRGCYRQELPCQIIHDSLHRRPGWTESYRLDVDGVPGGYGSIAIGGPWKGKPTVFEFYVQPNRRGHVFDWFEVLVQASGAVGIEVQTNDPLLTVMLHVYARDIFAEKILFRDGRTTRLPAPATAVFRAVRPGDADQLRDRDLDPEAGWLVESDGEPAAAGGVLFHYNRPYGDVYMKVAKPFRQRGFGSFLVQELKRVCHEGGSLPGARCNPDNLASRRTLQRAGFEPCGNILVGSLPR